MAVVLIIASVVSIAACVDDGGVHTCSWPDERRTAAARALGSWRDDLQALARAAMSNERLEVFETFTEGERGEVDLRRSKPCVLRAVILPGLSMRVVVLSDERNVQAYLDNDSIPVASGPSQSIAADEGAGGLAPDASAAWYCHGAGRGTCTGYSVVLQTPSCSGLVVEAYYYESNDTSAQAARGHLSLAAGSALRWAEARVTCEPASHRLHFFEPPT